MYACGAPREAPAGDSPAVTASEASDYVVIGRVRKPHGVRGEVAVEVLTDVAGRFDRGAEFFLRASSGAASGRRQRVRVATTRAHQGVLLVRLEGIEDRDQARPLTGAVLEVARSESPAAGEGSYYQYELVGCVCVDTEAGELGEVTGLLEDGGGLVLEISDGRATTLVPFVSDYVRTIDRRSRRIELSLPPGLLDTCTSRS